MAEVMYIMFTPAGHVVPLQLAFTATFDPPGFSEDWAWTSPFGPHHLGLFPNLVTGTGVGWSDKEKKWVRLLQ